MIRPDPAAPALLSQIGSGRSNRDAIGARMPARTGNRTLRQEVSGGQSYLFAPEKTLTFGLSAARKIDSLEIRCPTGPERHGVTRRDSLPNRLDRPERSVRVRLVGSGSSNRDAIGARVTARIGNRTLTQEVSGGQSYLSAPEKTLTFGLGAARKIDSLEIRWPDGHAEVRRDLAGGARLLVQQGRP